MEEIGYIFTLSILLLLIATLISAVLARLMVSFSRTASKGKEERYYIIGSISITLFLFYFLPFGSAIYDLFYGPFEGNPPITGIFLVGGYLLGFVLVYRRYFKKIN